MSVSELAYVIFESADIPLWRSFARDVLGMAAVDATDGALYLKMDDRDFRVAVIPGSGERLVATGWAMDSEQSFDNLRSTLDLSGVGNSSATEDGIRLRRVQDYFSFRDPAGNLHEICWGPISDYAKFVSPVGVSGFVTGPLGLGHVVLPATNLEEVLAFFVGSMQFELSDIIHFDFGGQPVRVSFTHCNNQRQHSLALAGMGAPNGLVHMMFEVATLRDVGEALDRVEAHGLSLAMTLGQHVNDDCVSFYFISPQGFMLEIGCEGVLKDWTNHVVFETTRPSYWGHKFVLNG